VRRLLIEIEIKKVFITPKLLLVKAHTILKERWQVKCELFVKENDSIAQKMNYNGTSSTISWSFKDTEGGTKVTWQSKGNMSFFKNSTALNGGVEEVIENV
jgi:hypothetical protein